MIDSCREKYLVIAYKCVVVNKDPIFLNILRENYVTFGKNVVYFYNYIIDNEKFLALSDHRLELELRSLLYNGASLKVKRG